MNEDLSGILEKLNIDKDSISPEMIDNVIKMFNNISNNNNTNSDETSDANNTIDMETILKIKSILDKLNLNKDSPRSKLLQDLKPYLPKEKKDKIDQYIQIDKILEVLPLIGNNIPTNLYNDNQILLLSLITLLL